jgi:hypothetical protein
MDINLFNNINSGQNDDFLDRVMDIISIMND